MKTGRIITYVAAALFMCIQLSACKKDKDSDTGVSIVGTWKYLESDNGDEYYVFSEDKIRYSLSTEAGNRRSVGKSTYKLDGDVLNIGGGSIYKVRISGDTLILSSSADNDYKYLKSTAKTVEDWVKVINPEKVMNGLFSPTMTFDGSELVAAENSHYAYTKLAFINPVAKYITKTVACSEQYEGLEYANGKYWGTQDNDSRLYSISPVTGQVLSTSVQAANQISSIAASNTTIYCEAFGNRIFKYDIASALFDASTPISNISVNDMAYRAGYLYILSGNYIYKCNTTNFDAEETYYCKDYYLSNIAFDGTGNVWLMSSEDYLMKAQLN